MKLKLALNIGTQDAKRLGLEKVLRGETVNVKDDVADVLLQNGWAIRSDASGPEPEAVENAAKATNAGTFPIRQPRVPDEVAQNASETHKGGKSK